MRDTVKIMKALSEEIRLRIINILYISDLYVCEIVNVLELPQSTVSRHLIILKNANIIEYNKEGSWIKYSVIKNKSFDNIMKCLIEKELVNNKICKSDIIKLKEIINKKRGCSINKEEVK